MSFIPRSLEKLVAELSKLPSVGGKSANRLAFFLSNNPELSGQLSAALSDCANQIRQCSNCFFIAESDKCLICQDSRRDLTQICIVEKPADLIAIEQANVFKGCYHVLNALWAPLKGQGPEQMNIEHLLERVAENNVQEIIIATGSTVEGDATALYLAKVFAEKGLKTTRLAQGLPKGGDLEYLDDVTLTRALSGRTEV